MASINAQMGMKYPEDSLDRATPAEDASSRPVRAMIERLDLNASGLESSISRAYDRLAPILTPEDQPKAVVEEFEPTPVISGVADDLRVLAEQIRSAYRRLDLLIDRVEV